jgi:hypothetical protein
MRLLKSSQKVTKTGAEAVRGVTENLLMCDNGTALSSHRVRTISPLPLRVAKTGRNHLKEEFTPLLPTGIGERF